VKSGLADLNTRVGATYLRLDDPAQAMTYFRKGLVVRRELSEAEPNNLVHRLGVARSLSAVGDNGFRLGDRATAVASFDECLGIVQDLFRQRPKILAVKQELARAISLKGTYHLRVGEIDKARPLYERALTLTLELVNADDKRIDYQWDLGNAHYRLGQLALRAKDRAGARARFESSRGIREKLATQDKDNDRRQVELMLALAHCGDHARASRTAADLERKARPDNDLLVQLGQVFAQCVAAAESGPKVRSRYAAEALRVLQAAIAGGYRDEVYLKTEADFDPLRPLEEFFALLKKFKAK
jgi:tetratricopeptide (TPR) repeat protein